jgi:hypothetical protein
MATADYDPKVPESIVDYRCLGDTGDSLFARISGGSFRTSEAANL